MLLAVTVGLLISSHIVAAELRFSMLNKERGLSQGSINALTMDASGLLWIGTEDGLFRYDGYEVTVFRSDPDDLYSVQDNVITALAADSDGRVWVGSESDGISYYDSHENQFIRIDSESAGRSVSSIFITQSSKIAIIKSDLGLLTVSPDGQVQELLDPQTGRNLVSVTIENDLVTSILSNGEAIVKVVNNSHPADRERVDLIDGVVSEAWSIPSCQTLLLAAVANDTGKTRLFCHSNGKTELSSLNAVIDKTGLSLEDLDIRSVAEDRNGSIWISTITGLFRIKDEEITVSRHLPFDEHSLSSNKLTLLHSVGDTLFVGSEFDGLNILYTGQDSFRYFNLLNSATDFKQTPFTTNNHSCETATSVDYETVWSILKDTDGDLWVGNNTGLAVRKNGASVFVDHSRVGNDANYFDFCSVWALTEINGKIWAGIWGGLVSFDKETGEFTHIKPAANDPEEQTLSGKFVRLLLHDKARNSLWIGTNRKGLNRLDLANNTIKKYPISTEDSTSLPHGRVRSLYLDSTNRLWVGTGGGLSLWDEESDTFKTLRSSALSTDLSDEDVRAISESGDGKFWIGTGNGIDLFNSDSFQVEQRLNKKSGLPNTTVYAMVEDSTGNYWVTTADGLSYFNPETLEFQNFGYQDGLQSNEFNFNAWHRSLNDEIYVGGVSGLNILTRPSDKKSEKALPVLTLVLATDAQGRSKVVANNPVPGSSFTVDSAFRKLEFNYTIPGYSNNNQQTSRHRLSNIDTPWTYTDAGPQQAIFTNVSAGHHVFEISGVEDNSATEYRIYITPTLIERAWFRLLLAAIAVMLLAVLFFRYSRKRERRSLEALTRQHYRVLEHEIRPHLFRANDNLKKLKRSSTLRADDREFIETSISPLMERTIGFLNDVRNIANFEFALRKPKETYMLEDVVDSALLLLSNDSDRIIIDELDDVNIVTHEDAVYLVVLNLLTNALKYSEPAEPVNVKITAVNRDLIIECIDNGIGIDPGKVEAIYQPYWRLPLPENEGILGLGLGLAIVKQIVQTYNGSITVVDNMPKGSHFTVILKNIVSAG